MFGYELMPKCWRASALGGIFLPMNNCPSSGGLAQSRPCHVAGIEIGVSSLLREETANSAQVGKVLRDRGVEESGTRDPTYETGPLIKGPFTCWHSESQSRPMIRLHKARHTLRVFDLLFIPSLGLHILKSPNFLPQCNLLPQPIPAWSIRFLINTFTLICDSPWIFIPTKLKYLYFKRGFLNGWCLNHGTFRRFGSYTDLLICLLASFSGYRCFVFVYFIILSPSFNKKFLFFSCRETIPCDMVEPKTSSLPSHHQVWPNVTHVSQSGYPVLLGTEIIWR